MFARSVMAQSGQSQVMVDGVDLGCGKAPQLDMAYGGRPAVMARTNVLETLGRYQFEELNA